MDDIFKGIYEKNGKSGIFLREREREREREKGYTYCSPSTSPTKSSVGHPTNISITMPVEEG